MRATTLVILITLFLSGCASVGFNTGGPTGSIGGSASNFPLGLGCGLAIGVNSGVPNSDRWVTANTVHNRCSPLRAHILPHVAEYAYQRALAGLPLDDSWQAGTVPVPGIKVVYNDIDQWAMTIGRYTVNANVRVRHITQMANHTSMQMEVYIFMKGFGLNHQGQQTYALLTAERSNAGWSFWDAHGRQMYR